MTKKHYIILGAFVLVVVLVVVYFLMKKKKMTTTETKPKTEPKQESVKTKKVLQNPPRFDTPPTEGTEILVDNILYKYTSGQFIEK